MMDINLFFNNIDFKEFIRSLMKLDEKFIVGAIYNGTATFSNPITRGCKH